MGDFSSGGTRPKYSSCGLERPPTMFTGLYSTSDSWMKKGFVVAVLLGSAVDAFHAPAQFSAGYLKLRNTRSPVSISMATAAPSKFEAMRKKYSR